MSQKLGDILEVRQGDRVFAEILEGDREKRRLEVAGFIEDPVGLQGYMELSSLHRFLREPPTVSNVLLRIDPVRSSEIYGRLRDKPHVVRVHRRASVTEQFNERTGEMMTTFTLILTLFASVIAIGVVYNNARNALSIRSRDFASLRVLGFWKSEVSKILLGELALQVLLALPLGLFVGTQMAHALMASVDPETWRLPVVIAGQTYAFAVVVTLACAIASGLLVRRRVDRLDLIGVLKTST